MLSIVDGRPIVQRASDGRVAIWAGAPEDPTGLMMSPSAGLEVARDLLAAVAPSPEPKAQRGRVLSIDILPPAEPGQTGRLLFITDLAMFDLLIDWRDLTALANTAAVALERATSIGEG